MNNNGKKSLSQILRLYVFIVGLVVSFSVAVITLINYQIVDVDKYVKLAENGNQIKQIVPAGRGEILDRYGKKLATSSLELSLVINKEFPIPNSDDDKDIVAKKYKEGNDIILKIVQILDESGIDWGESMCITRSAPCEFKGDKIKEANKLKTTLSQQKYATAQDAIALLVEKFNITGYNEQQTRDIAIVRAMMLIKDFSYSGIFTLVEKIDSSFAGKVIEIKNLVKGITISETSTRKYPSEDVAAHIIGTVGPIYAEEAEKYKNQSYALSDFVGKSGVESKFEEELRGKNGLLTIEKDKEGNTINHYYMEGDEPQPGNNIRLSIDYEFQKRLQEALGAYTKSHSSKHATSKGAGLVVLDVKTGEVLAAVTYPYYNINDYNNKYNELKAQSLGPLKNRAFVELYRPGSTWKTTMSAIGLYTKAITPSTRFNCSNPFLDTKMECEQLGRHSGLTSLYTALQWSCNNYFYNVAKILTIDRIDEFAPYFGFGTDTGLELYNSDGRVTNPTYYREHGQPYYVGETYQTGIGQAEVYVTPLQMALSQLTLANKGTRYAAHILKSIDKYDGSETIAETHPQILSELSKDSVAWDTTISGMKQMASTVSSLSGLDIATKSGSPQYSNNTALTNSAGVGIYPASNPEIAMGLMIEDGDSASAFFSQVVSIYNELKQARQQ